MFTSCPVYIIYILIYVRHEYLIFFFYVLWLRATMVIPRDYSPLTRWDRSNNLPRSSSCSNSRDQCRRQGLQHLLGSLRFLRKPSPHLRPPQPANFHLALILVLQILRPNIGCNGPLLHLQLRLSCQVGWYSVLNFSSLTV